MPCFSIWDIHIGSYYQWPMIMHQVMVLYSWSSNASSILLNPYIIYIYIWVHMQNVCIGWSGPKYIILWRCRLSLFIRNSSYCCLPCIIYIFDEWYWYSHVNARIMKFIPNKIRIMFSKLLVLLWFLILILKTLMFDLWIFIHKIKRCFWWKIAKTVKNSWWKILKKFNYMSFDRSGIPFSRSNVLFNWSKRNRESIESSRNSMLKFFIVSIDREFLSIDWMLISINRTGIENQSNEVEPLWWISSFFDRSSNRLDQSKALNFEFSLVFWLSVKTLIKSKAMWLIL